MTKEMFKKVTSENIKKERVARGLAIEELANLMNITPGFMGLIERNKRGITAFNLYKLANLFNIDMHTLISENGNNETSDEKIQNRKKQKIAALTSQLDDNELDFVIATIKNLEIYRCNN